MPRISSRRRFLLAAAASISSLTAGCGTFLHPERLGQPRTGPIDWKIVALDGIALVLFVVPGVIAFAVDWYTGTLFLPQTPYYGVSSPGRPDVVSIALKREQLSREGLETVIRQHTGQTVALEPGKYHTRQLPSLDEFPRAAELLEQEAAAQPASRNGASSFPRRRESSDA